MKVPDACGAFVVAMTYVGSERCHSREELVPPCEAASAGTFMRPSMGYGVSQMEYEFDERQFLVPSHTKLATRDLLILSSALVLAKLGMTRVAALYARIVFERLGGKSGNTQQTFERICNVRRWKVRSLRPFNKAYRVLSSAVHGGSPAKERIAAAIVAVYVFGNEVAL